MSENYIKRTLNLYSLPSSEYKTDGDELLFNDINLPELIKKEGSPLKLFYLPQISKNINRCNKWFNVAFENNRYNGKHHYSYCTKSNHFLPVVDKTLKSGSHLEVSSSFDFKLIDELINRQSISKSTFIICNGFKTDGYLKNIFQKLDQGYKNTLPIIDNKKEAQQFWGSPKRNFNYGIRLSTNEDQNHSLNTSRFGISEKEALEISQKGLKHKHMRLVMLHFFINSGITDTDYYWKELENKISFYCKLKAIHPELKSINIGGGLKTFSSLNKYNNHQNIVDKIVKLISNICNQHKTEVPDIFTEFGNYTVSNCACTIFSVIGKKQQDKDIPCLIINSSFITTLPDIWAIDKDFPSIAINNLDIGFEEVYFGGLSCDGDDFYDSIKNKGSIYMPIFEKANNLHVGFFNTGAYQEALGGFGGLQHCLIPSPKYIFADFDKNKKLTFTIFKNEQTAEDVISLIS